MKNKSSYMLMFIAFFVYSLSGILSKIASITSFFSLYYFLCFFGTIFILGIYAVFWQQVLKQIDLSIAMSYKPIVLPLGLLWAALFFDEKLNISFFVGFIMILIGSIIIGYNHE